MKKIIQWLLVFLLTAAYSQLRATDDPVFVPKSHAVAVNPATTSILRGVFTSSAATRKVVSSVLASGTLTDFVIVTEIGFDNDPPAFDHLNVTTTVMTTSKVTGFGTRAEINDQASPTLVLNNIPGEQVNRYLVMQRYSFSRPGNVTNHNTPKQAGDYYQATLQFTANYTVAGTSTVITSTATNVVRMEIVAPVAGYTNPTKIQEYSGTRPNLVEYDKNTNELVFMTNATNESWFASTQNPIQKSSNLTQWSVAPVSAQNVSYDVFTKYWSFRFPCTGGNGYFRLISAP